MIIIDPSYEILNTYGDLKLLDTARRTCYKSIAKNEDYSTPIQQAISNGHKTIIEHGGMTVRFIADRGFTHELVRHRMAVYSQESTRWCNYAGKGIVLIHPPELSDKQKERREVHFWAVQALYDQEILEGVKPQIARGVLPTALKTEIVMTANFREWRLVFEQRALGLTGKPHPQMLELMIPLLKDVAILHPTIFGDLAKQLEVDNANKSN